MSVVTAVVTAITAMIVTIAIGRFLIPVLRKMKFGQTILDIGPRWHKNKEGTPTMGGLMFIFGIIVAICVGYFSLKISITKNLDSFTQQNFNSMFAGVVMAVLFAAIGMIDDMLKILRKQNLGLTEMQKMILQFIVAGGYLLVLHQIGYRETTMWIPFIGLWEMGPLYYVISLLGIVFMVNVVNFTDGVDGLCASVTAVSSVGFLLVSIIFGQSNMGMIASALFGGCLGFLFWNIYPAKVFMGDTGSLFLGGMIVALMYGLRTPMLILFRALYTSLKV